MSMAKGNGSVREAVGNLILSPKGLFSLSNRSVSTLELASSLLFFTPLSLLSSCINYLFLGE